MLEFYWGLLVTGVLFAIVTVLFGDLLSNALDGALDWMSGDVAHWFQPMVLFSGLTVLGGAGVLLTKYTGLGSVYVLILGILAAVLAAVLLYLLYVKPMSNTENSIAFSMKDLVGHIGEVTVAIPSRGYGEVVLRIGGGLTNQIAKSFDGTDIPLGMRVVIVDTEPDTLLVSILDTEPNP